MSERRTLFDRPLWKDWAIWLALAAMAVAVPTVLGSYRDPVTDEVNVGDEMAAFLFDLWLAFAFQFVLFGVVPALIRSAVRRRNRPQS